MGDSEVTSARYYQFGAAGRLNLDRLPLTGFQTTWSVKPAASAPYKPDYDPDSASTGTMWATGVKTIDERISQGPSSAENVPGRNLRTILERAQRQGKRTGNVSTAEITDATPAMLDSHISLRGSQGPQTLRPAAPRRPRRRAGSARSPSRPSTTGSTSSWAAAARASSRRSPAARTTGRPSSSTPRTAAATPRSPTPRAWPPRGARTARCSGSSPRAT
jgi:hypothetical protein